MSLYGGVGGVRKEITPVYAGVNGAAKELKSLLAGVDGVSKELLGGYTWKKYNAVAKTTTNTDYNNAYYLYTYYSQFDGLMQEYVWMSASECADMGFSIGSSHRVQLDTTDYEEWTFQYYKSTSTTTYSKGSTYYGEVTSSNKNAYPSNGRSGSYWYVLQT